MSEVRGEPSGVPATCASCGAVYVSGLFVTPILDTAADAMRLEYRYDPVSCPRCGAWNDPVSEHSAEYRVLADAVQLVAGMAARDRLELLSALQRLQRAEATIAELQSAAPPPVRSFLARLTDSPVALLGLLVSLVALWPQFHSGSDDLSPGDVGRIVRAVLDATTPKPGDPPAPAP